MSFWLRQLIFIVFLLAFPLLLNGCGGGGGSTSLDGNPIVVGGTTTPEAASGLSVSLQARNTVPAKVAVASAGHKWRVHVRAAATGEDLAPPVTVAAPTSEGGTVTVSFGRVSPQADVILVEVLSRSGAVMSAQTAPFKWTPAVQTTGQTVAMTVTMPLVSLGESLVRGLPPAVNVPAGGTVQLRAFGGAAPYQFFFENVGTGSRVDLATGLVTAGTGVGTDFVTIRDQDRDEKFVIVNVAPALSLSPASASVGPGAKVQFKVSGPQGTTFVWQLAVNRSGGSIDSTTGAYVAGPYENAVDVVEARDAAGHRAAALVSVGSPLTIGAPFSDGAMAGETLPLTVSGGCGPYVWHYANNASGGVLDSQTGVYRAGEKNGVTDVVAVSDVSGAMQVFEMAVAAPLSIRANPSLFVPRGQEMDVAAIGGFPPYRWTFSATSNSFFIDLPTTGKYGCLGPVGAVDTLTLTDSHDHKKTVNITIAPELVIESNDRIFVQGGSYQFRAAGGTGGPYTWSVRSQIGSTIDPTTGAYRAGVGEPITAYRDNIAVTDGSGYLQVVSLTVDPF